MRVMVTGQVGVGKKGYLEAVQQLAGQEGQAVGLYHVGDRMYAEAPDVKVPHILDLPLSRLNALRRAVFKDIISESVGQEHIMVNTHATFRWRHGLFSAFDFDQVQKLQIDGLMCLLDNIEVVHHRLHGEHTVDATFKDLMVWREEEIMATELLAQALGCSARFYILSRGRHVETHETCWRLISKPKMRRVYLSFPMTHVVDMPEVLAEIDAFRAQLAKQFIAFDPGDVDEKILLDSAISAAKDGKDFISAPAGAESGGQGRIRVAVKQVLDIAGDIDGQIYARDFKMVDQSDMIVSLVPQLPGGTPGLSSGVERELHHAFEHGKEVYVIWKPERHPSPFVTKTATKVFASTDEALAYFAQSGMFGRVKVGGR